MDKVKIVDKFRKFDDLWSPKLVGELNENYIKLAKGQGELDWHTLAGPLSERLGKSAR